METVDKFIEWLTNYDKHILGSHISKDKAALEKSVKELEAEYKETRKYHARLESLLETAHHLKEIVESNAKGSS